MAMNWTMVMQLSMIILINDANNDLHDIGGKGMLYALSVRSWLVCKYNIWFVYLSVLMSILKYLKWADNQLSSLKVSMFSTDETADWSENLSTLRFMQSLSIELYINAWEPKMMRAVKTRHTETPWYASTALHYTDNLNRILLKENVCGCPHLRLKL